MSFGDPWLVITTAASELQSGRFWVEYPDTAQIKFMNLGVAVKPKKPQLLNAFFFQL